MADLERIQRWLQAVITHPAGVAEGAAAARQHLDVGPDEVERVVTRSRALGGLERLAIYGDAYYARLLECLREEFPVLAHALGEELFDAFGIGYLQKYPSRSYTLTRLAARFPRYLTETRPAAADGEDRSAGWPDFLADLARLEWTCGEVFDAPGDEGEPLLDSAGLRTVPEERWPEARLVPARSLRLLALRYPVQDYFAAVRRQENPAPPEAAGTFLAVTRRDYVVRHQTLTRPAYELLRDLADGRSLGEAVGRAARTADADLDALADNLRDWFQAWAARGYFRAVALGESTPSTRSSSSAASDEQMR
jgi:hypothetical protein